MERIEIYSSKKKSLLLLIGSIAFVALGIWLLLEADNLTGWRARNPIFTRGIGIASILFFGLGIFVGIKRLIKSEISLIIDPKGLNVNPNYCIGFEDSISGIDAINLAMMYSVGIGDINILYKAKYVVKSTKELDFNLIKYKYNKYKNGYLL